MALNDFIEERLATCGSLLSVHVMADTFGPSDALDSRSCPQGGAKEFLKCRRLILVFQSRPGGAGDPRPEARSLPDTPTKKRPAAGSSALAAGGKQVLVLGMCACEYAERQNPEHIVRAYIQYVDTTGLFEPREDQSKVTKSLISAYVAYQQTEARASFIHLLALARPNYLFPGSEHFASKRVLDTADLVQWWLRVLSASVGPHCDAVIHGYAPERFGGSEKVLAHELFGSVPRRPGVSFHYGLPFRATDCVDDAVPLFEDDPKWRLYEHLYLRSARRESRAYEYAEDDDAEDPAEQKKTKAKPTRTVQEFVQALTTRPEFFKDPEAAIIVVEFPANEQQRRQRSSGGASNAATKTKELLFSLNFSDLGQALSSSAKLFPWVRFMGSRGITIDGSTKSPGQSPPKRAAGEPENRMTN